MKSSRPPSKSADATATCLEIKSTQARQHSAPATCCTYGRVNLNRSARHHDGDAALEIKCCRSLGLATPPLASSLCLVRATKLPALTGKSMSNLARKPPSESHAVGCEDGAARNGPVPGANDGAPAANTQCQPAEARTSPPARATARHERRGPLKVEDVAARAGPPPDTNDEARVSRSWSRS